MHFAVKNLQQDITYWAPGGMNDYGHPTSGAPVLLKGRWQDKQQQVMGARGEEITSSAEVFLPQAVAISGFLALGDHTDSNVPVSDAREIQNFNSEPDLRNLGSLWKAYL